MTAFLLFLVTAFFLSTAFFTVFCGELDRVIMVVGICEDRLERGVRYLG